jgi:hypothetical protein
MALEPISNDVMAQICQTLGVTSLNRPHAAFIDPGDFGTVFTYLPLFVDEYKKLPPTLQRYVYVVSKGRYGLVAFVPKNFELPQEGEIDTITETYDEFGNLREMTYNLKESTTLYRLETSLRREKLQALAKKKKIHPKKIIRSRS